mmetsp:Transcript_28430/g.81911  ORF Transcript_28430/g.81911 Transcript_28430/m.81911 type:complete len:373 (+) Transcript_28430:203-1321(+)
MQPTGATPSSQPLPSSVPSLLGMAIGRAADMAMSPHAARRATLLSLIAKSSNSHPHKVDMMLQLVKQHVEAVMSRLGVQDVLDFDIVDLEGGMKVAYVLAAGSGDEWRAMGHFIRLAAICRLTPNAALPLRLSAHSWEMATFHELPLAMAIYRLFGHLLNYKGTSLALQLSDRRYGGYRIGDKTFRVVPLGDLPGGHPYADSYKRSDPAVRDPGRRPDLYPTFSAFLLRMVVSCWRDEDGVGQRRVLLARRGDPRRGRVLTEGIPGDLGIAVDHRHDHGNLNAADASDHRRVIASGFRPGETAVAHLTVGPHAMHLWTAEAPVDDPSQPLAQRFPMSMPLWCGVLRHFDLETDVISGGTLVGVGLGWWSPIG